MPSSRFRVCFVHTWTTSFFQKGSTLSPFFCCHESQRKLTIFFRLTGLGHLCEFIEDCEHTVLATRILHLLGREGPRSQNPSKYIRFIYNRVILENAAVRAGKNDVDPRLFFSRESRSNWFFFFFFSKPVLDVHQINYWFLLVLPIRFNSSSVLLIFTAAVTSLAKFGAHCDSLCSSILVLLSRFVY